MKPEDFYCIEIGEDILFRGDAEVVIGLTIRRDNVKKIHLYGMKPFFFNSICHELDFIKPPLSRRFIDLLKLNIAEKKEMDAQTLKRLNELDWFIAKRKDIIESCYHLSITSKIASKIMNPLDGISKEATEKIRDILLEEHRFILKTLEDEFASY